MYSNTTASYNTAVGYAALNDANRTADVNAYNTAIGYNAGNSGTNDITTGQYNVLLGASTAASQATASNQIVIGYDATGQADNSVVLGNADVTTVYASQDAGATLHAGAVNLGGTAVTSTAAELNLLDGVTAIATSLNGLSDALIEDNSLYLGNIPSGTTSTASYNVAVGIDALDAITTGERNVAVGYNALTSNATADGNTASGYESLEANTTGQSNVAIGTWSLTANTTGSWNTAEGYQR